MARQTFNLIGNAIDYSIESLKLRGEKVDTGHWQGIPTGGKPDLITKEILDLVWSAPIPHQSRLIDSIEPSWPWCENHFQERVSRDPSNPGHEYKNWPWWRGQFDVTNAIVPDWQENHAHIGTEHKFTHTYQERFWPRIAGDLQHSASDNLGIRYRFGDLDDVVDLLVREPYTRQAYLPIFFPEDTGAVHGGRIPCSLGYHFLLRANRLHCWYDIRSCDAVRHFRDDLYLACRLTEWVVQQLQDRDLEGREDARYIWGDVIPGRLYFTAHSFHVHIGDYHLL